MIVAQSKQPAGVKYSIINQGKAGFAGSAYTGFKHIAKAYGFYKDIEPYLPETYIDKYRYKPHKRVYHAISKTKGFLLLKKHSNFHKKRTRFFWGSDANENCGQFRQGCYFA